MYYGNVTFTMSLPRSRTAWIAEAFASAGGAITMHDPLKRCASIAELGERIDSILKLAVDRDQHMVVVDTAAVFFYPQIAARFPEARFLFIDRVRCAVELSLRNAGRAFDPDALREAEKLLGKAAYRASRGRFMRRVEFGRLSDTDVLLQLWQFFGFRSPFPREHFKKLAATNIQVPFDQQLIETDLGKVERLFATRHEGW